jgi:hypothetical protein
MGNNKMNVKTILLNENLDEGLYMKLEFFFFFAITQIVTWFVS